MCPTLRLITMEHYSNRLNQSHTRSSASACQDVWVQHIQTIFLQAHRDFTEACFEERTQ